MVSNDRAGSSPASATIVYKFLIGPWCKWQHTTFWQLRLQFEYGWANHFLRIVMATV